MGISLWLVPNASTAPKIKTLMQLKPSFAPQSPSSFPSFHPHITLATSQDADALRASLKAKLPQSRSPIPVRFKSLMFGNKYFMSVFVAVHSPPGSALEDLRGYLRATLGEGTVPPLPHMSLYYIDGADEAERERVARRLESELRVLQSARGEDSAVKLVCVPDEGNALEKGQRGMEEPELLEGFDGEEIWLVKCDGPVPGWEVLEMFSLVPESE